ncbi:hypothetical protein [Bacillus thermotolerans]|uniref:Uncharacterized protein n=1 Tax=Bacillus thermotolerans TaxID=1221996 RepID=A0A0F5I9V4_BACTR|nr:hypothetical protein [Bacillus thermotolerans]KKB39204.1 hypothetical protein QY97_00106 [Bacillus thermotolerans]KKB41960.1 hypothetical protein QY96_01755 [Bacillus thermotolerans]KKB42218.1 hypothetical protein QY95_00067 [Bacillus thermotolerans]
MRQLINGLTTHVQSKEQLAVIRLELDYELAVLFEAMQEKDKKKIEKSKDKLNELREQMLQLEA